MRLPTLTELVAAVQTAGAIINRNFGLPHTVTEKSDGTPVTAIDHEINSLFCQLAHKHGIGFLGEEGNGITDCEWILYVDPLDGTGAFTRGMATVTIAASILFRGEPIKSVIHNPVTGQTWSTEHTHPCTYTRNGSPEVLAFVDRTPQEKYRTAICIWPGVDQQFADFQNRVLLDPRFSDQQMGAFAIGGGLIASGLIHATVISATSAVETAAMSHIVREAGGIAIDLQGNPLERFELGEHKGKADFLLPHGAIMACSGEVAHALLALYQK